MKKLAILIIILAVAVAGCASAPTAGPVAPQSMDLQEFVKQLEDLNKGSIETKRTAAIAVLDNWLFDGGYWSVVLENQQVIEWLHFSSEHQQVVYQYLYNLI